MSYVDSRQESLTEDPLSLQRLKERLYGDPNSAVWWLIGVGAGVGFLISGRWQVGCGLWLVGYLSWLRIAPYLVIDNLGLGPLINEIPQTERRSEREVWLTFDDGPGPQTEAILDVLETFGVPATFFMIGEQVWRYDRLDVLKTRLEHGRHRVGNHSWSHPNFLMLTPDATRREIESTDDYLREVFGTLYLPAFRPPYGYRTSRMFTVLQERNFIPIGWTLNSLDFLSGPAQRIVERVVGTIAGGQILLFHDGPKRRQATVEALAFILEDLLARGYVFSTPHEELKR